MQLKMHRKHYSPKRHYWMKHFKDLWEQLQSVIEVQTKEYKWSSCIITLFEGWFFVCIVLSAGQDHSFSNHIWSCSTNDSFLAMHVTLGFPLLARRPGIGLSFLVSVGVRRFPNGGSIPLQRRALLGLFLVGRGRFCLAAANIERCSTATLLCREYSSAKTLNVQSQEYSRVQLQTRPTACKSSTENQLSKPLIKQCLRQ